MDLYSSPMAPRRMLSTQSSPLDSAHKDLINPQKTKHKGPLRERTSKWVKPSVSRPRQAIGEAFLDSFSSCLESSFDVDCGSSLISLDFGLVSPNTNWCSPPQRIERAQNREWFSPHCVIDRPNPENSPGNWISMQESCLPLRHSPALGIKSQQIETLETPAFTWPDPGPRPPSQSTYIVPNSAKSLEPEPKTSQLKRKTSVLVDYEPERIVRNRGEPLAGNEKIRRVVNPEGHVIKISLLEDFETPAFGKTNEVVEKAPTEPSDKPNRTIAHKTKKISSILSPSASKPQPKTKKEESKEKSGTSTRIQSSDEVAKRTSRSAQEEKKTSTIKEEKEDKANENKVEDVSRSTQKIIQDLEEILRPSDKESDKLSGSSLKEKPKLKRFKPYSKTFEEKTAETVEKRKRNVDPKAVHEYMKSQKQKRMEQVKTEKKTKDAEKEARKKKLEELRIKTLKLAAQSKKKKPFQSAIKVVEPGTEDDVTVSLGLKQIKPKVSYNESVSKLKKKSSQQQKIAQSTPIEMETTELPAEKFVNEEDNNEILEDLKIIRPEKKLQVEELDIDLKKPDDVVEAKASSDLNATLKKLAETLHLKLEQKEKQFRSRPGSLASKSIKDPLSQVPSQDTLRSVKSAPEENRQMVAVDLETIQTLKSDIKKISENFKVLHEIIIDKADLSGKVSVKEQPLIEKPQVSCREESKKVPFWLRPEAVPRPYPYNVFTAFQQKMNLKSANVPSSVSQGSSTFAEPISNKYDSEFEALSVPSDRLCSAKVGGSLKSTSHGTSEVKCYSMKEDSGSDLSSSILDSEKQSWINTGNKNSMVSQFQSKRSSSESSVTSSIVTGISSRSIHLATSRALTSTHSGSSLGKISSDRENLILVTPDLKLISNDLHEDKLNNHTKNLNVMRDTPKVIESEELNNTEKSYKEQKSDSTIAELIDNLTDNEKSSKSLKSINEKPQNLMRRVEEVHVRRSFFQPEMLHLQFQAELTLLETFQKSLSHFLEAERMKTLSEVNKIVYEKAINTEKLVEKEDQAVQTSCIKESPNVTMSEETDSVRTEIAVEESTKTEKPESAKLDLISVTLEKLSSSEENLNTTKEAQQKMLKAPDFKSSHMGISFEMLNRMMKDEELRSEHQLALIRLREKTSNEKVKAELTFLEMKKRALKDRGTDEEQNISAIKKKQRGILLKYQSEKEEIERLKKMHRIASEERKIMIKQQKQIQQMQMSTNDMIIKLKRRKTSPTKKSPLKAKAFKSSDNKSEISEDIPIVSDSMLTESICSAEESARHSTCSDLDLSSKSNVSKEDSELLRRSGRTLLSKMSYSLENLKTKKSLLEVEKYPRKRHSVEELFNWTRRLEEKENHLKELEKQAMSAAIRAKRSKPLKNIKAFMKDRSTSPFQFPDSAKTISEVCPSDAVEIQKSLTISEAVESNSKTEATKTESVIEKIQSSAGEDIPEQFSKKISTSRTAEYYSESFESPSSSETPKTKRGITGLKSLVGGHWGFVIKQSLSPRMQSPRRRCSSGSDESVTLSHTETASEQSDLESRIAALHEQLRKRKLEAERLRREQKKVQRERLKVKEQSLVKQIQAYDAYIQKKKQELEQEYERSSQITMKPLIKQPKAAEKLSLKRQEPVIANDSEKHDLYTKLAEKNKDETLEKTTESDYEVPDQVKDTSESFKEVLEEFESIKEQIESQIEEEKSAVAGSVPGAANSAKENYSTLKSTSLSESLLEQDVNELESEAPSISIKTALHSPEKITERIDTIATVTDEEESQNKHSLDNDLYQLDSFESDVEEKMIAGSKNLHNSPEISEPRTEITSEVGGFLEEEEEYEKEEIEQQLSVESDNSEVLISQIPEEVETKKIKSEAECITDSIITGWILESLKIFCKKKSAVERKLAEQSKLSLEVLSSYLAKEIMSEAVDDMLDIYNRKAALEAEFFSPDRSTSKVRKRVSEIMSQATGTKDSKRPQDLMVTTYDVSPVTTPPGETTDATEREKFLQTLSFSGSEGDEKSEEEGYSEGDDGAHYELKSETFGQEWIDDDFGLSQTRREAEELRLQQLQIEQEIQQLQAQQEQVPYFYLREIPNKPPPPYTPPGKPLAEIPTSEAEIAAITFNAVRILTEEMSKGIKVTDIEPTHGYYEGSSSEHLKCYKLFLFDLAKHIISELINQQESKDESLPWMRTREHLSKYKYRKIERTFDSLNDFVQKQVTILLGFGKKVSKESLIVKWIKKKRDHVDEILVGESQEEEAQWTQYDEDQVTVKNEVTSSILDGLLYETAQVVNLIFRNKMKKEKFK